ncbi:FecCD family ABC transporter permease [Janibacter sp. Soil728]|uniref:FecCD family ABC transporter permease n=1 Tax=Janibacter sp. Soil728 TaxID=1736393 RepID=UPI000AE9A1C2|nr:iron ABC transporter permease [Janibacter sp. Soil728]
MTSRTTARRTPRTVLVLAGCVVVLALVCLLSLAVGSKSTSLPEVIGALTGRPDTYLATVLDSRIERTLLALGVGAALALSGALMQGVTSNPLADPGLLGINAGAAAAMVTASAFFGIATGSPASAWVALLGGGIAAVVVHTIGTVGGAGASLVRLVLAGAVVAAVLNAYVQGLALSMPQHFDSYRFWVVGSLGDGGLDHLRSVGPFLVVGLVLALLSASGLNALALGSETATGLGVNTTLLRVTALGAATLLCAAATAAVGPIAFVGLAVPHIVRSLVGLDVRRQLLTCLLVGPIVLLGADIIGRVVLRPQELMVGVVTAFVGAPVLLLAVRRLGKRAA